jgi:hypothetical protein
MKKAHLDQIRRDTERTQLAAERRRRGLRGQPVELE